MPKYGNQKARKANLEKISKVSKTVSNLGSKLVSKMKVSNGKKRI